MMPYRAQFSQRHDTTHDATQNVVSREGSLLPAPAGDQAAVFRHPPLRAVPSRNALPESKHSCAPRKAKESSHELPFFRPGARARMPAGPAHPRTTTAQHMLFLAAFTPLPCSSCQESPCSSNARSAPRFASSAGRLNTPLLTAQGHGQVPSLGIKACCFLWRYLP